jgi:hypothetical protein
MKPGIEILHVAAMGGAADSPLRRICRDVQRLETALGELPDSPDTSQLATLIEFLAYQAMSLDAGDDLDALEKMIRDFRARLELDPGAEGHPLWMSDSMRELSRQSRPHDLIDGSAFVLPRVNRPRSSYPSTSSNN